MDIEYTGRQTTVTDEMRTMAQPFMDRVEKMLGHGATAHVIVTAEKHQHAAEVQVRSGAHDLVGLADSQVSAEVALRNALEKAEAQAVRFKEKQKTQKRQPKDEKTLVEPALERGGKGKRTGLMPTQESPIDGLLGLAPDIAPGGVSTLEPEQEDLPSEPHVTRSIDALALQPMSLEMAIKELETRNRDLFVFRDHAGLLRILHCKRDGVLELIELP